MYREITAKTLNLNAIQSIGVELDTYIGVVKIINLIQSSGSHNSNYSDSNYFKCDVQLIKNNWYIKTSFLGCLLEAKIACHSQKLN